MPAESAYSPKRSDVVLFRINNLQQLNTPATLVTTFLTPTVPSSGLMPWWLTHPVSTQFVFQPGTYAVGMSLYTLVATAATNGSISSARIIFKINGVNDSWHRVTLDMVPSSGAYLNTQHGTFDESKLEFGAVTTLEFETQATIAGNAVIETRTGSHIYIVRYN